MSAPELDRRAETVREVATVRLLTADGKERKNFKGDCAAPNQSEREVFCHHMSNSFYGTLARTYGKLGSPAPSS